MRTCAFKPHRAAIYPEDPLVAAYHDMLYEQCLDISNTVAGNFKLPEDARVRMHVRTCAMCLILLLCVCIQGPARQQLMSETWPRLFEALDRELVKNGGPFLTGNTVSKIPNTYRSLVRAALCLDLFP
jgi:hypothetical protein